MIEFPQAQGRTPRRAAAHYPGIQLDLPENWQDPKSWSPEFVSFCQGQVEQALTELKADHQTALERLGEGISDPFQHVSPHDLKRGTCNAMGDLFLDLARFSEYKARGELSAVIYKQVREQIYQRAIDADTRAQQAPFLQVMFPQGYKESPIQRDWAALPKQLQDIRPELHQDLRRCWDAGIFQHLNALEFDRIAVKVLTDLYCEISCGGGFPVQFAQTALSRVKRLARDVDFGKGFGTNGRFA